MLVGGFCIKVLNLLDLPIAFEFDSALNNCDYCSLINTKKNFIISYLINLNK